MPFHLSKGKRMSCTVVATHVECNGDLLFVDNRNCWKWCSKKKTTEGRRGNPVAPNKETSVPYCSGDLLSSNECFLYRQQSQCTYRRTVKLDFMQHQNRFIYTPLLGEQRYTKSHSLVRIRYTLIKNKYYKYEYDIVFQHYTKLFSWISFNSWNRFLLYSVT